MKKMKGDNIMFVLSGCLQAFSGDQFKIMMLTYLV